ncbi:hypothetical protein [Gracilimonas mengyeensis]|nr:hypothetical protein [Gracilimonas mengyeensis]
MKLNKTLLALVVLVFAAVSCEDYVQNVDDPINLVPEENLVAEDQVQFLMDGVTGRFHITHDALTVIAVGLSDAFVFDRNVPNATFPTFEEIDLGEIPIDNNSVDGPYTNLGQARYLADNLLSKVEQIEFSDADLETAALFNGNLYAGLTRAAYASYFGLNPTQGGSPVDNSDFIPSAQLYDQAVTHLETALANASSDYETRLVNSLIGRIYIYQNEHSAAQPYLEAGLQPGDDAFASQHSLESQNAFYTQAGASRTQYSVASRFADYIADNAEEANRLEIEEVVLESGFSYWRSTKGPETPINIITWQENNLMLAEVELEGGTLTGSLDALGLVNEVRASHDISPLASIDMETLFVERDKELMQTGNRVIDQRRTGNWHLGAGTWQYFPVTQSERNGNPNCCTGE